MKKRLFPAIIIGCCAQILAAQIQISFNLVSPACHGSHDGSITVQAVGGTGSYTYLWSNGQTYETLSGIGAGTYSVTVTDDAQQSAAETVELTQSSAISPAVTAQNINCEGTSGTLTASVFGGIGPYQFNWGGPNNSSTETVEVVAPGVYTITVTDARQCTGTHSYQVSSALELTVTALDIKCADDPNSGKVTTLINGGMPPFSYQWSTGGSTQTLEHVGAGEYFCTVTGANGCLITASDVVDMPPPFGLQTIGLTPACGGASNGSASVTANGGAPPYQFTWNPGGLSGPAQTGLAAGTFSVLAEDANQCQNELEVTIPATQVLDVQLLVKSATCVGVNDAEATAIVKPVGSGYIYQWNILPPDSNVIQITGLTVGTLVSVTVTDPVSGCSGSASGIVGAHSNLEVLVTDVDIPCAGGLGSALAEASEGTPPYQYSWLNGSGQLIGDEAAIDSLLPGAYQVNVVDSLGCTGSGVADIGLVSAPNAVIDGDSVLVCGDSLSVVQFTNLSFDTYNQIVGLEWTVTGPSVDTVIINENQLVFQLPVDETILVQLVATSSTGCKDTAWLSYNVPGYPPISLSLDTTTYNCTQQPVQIDVTGGDSTYTYVWTPMVTFNPDPLHVLASPNVETTYILVATDGNACTAVDSITIPALDSLLMLFVGDTLVESCEDSVLLFATANVPAEIIWSQGNTVFTSNPVWVPATSVLTYYTATAITEDSCVLSRKVGVMGQGIQISIDSLMPLSICEGDSLPLSVMLTPADAVVQYQWSVPAPAILIQPNTAMPILTGPAGVYVVTVVATRTFCSDTLSFTVTIHPSDSLDGDITVDLCNGLTVSFTNASQITGLWDFGDGTPKSSEVNPVHTYQSPGMYLVAFSPDNQFNCVAPWDSMIMVVEDSLAAAIVHAYQNCAVEAQIQFFGEASHSAIISWSWQFSNGDPGTSELQNPVITYVEEGAYLATLTIEDINQCIATASVMVQVDIIADQITENTLICLFDSIELNPTGIDTAAHYFWTSVPADPTLDANDPNPVVMPLAPIVYSVEISKGFCTVNYAMEVNFFGADSVSLPTDTLIVCSMDSVTITAQSSGPANLEWSNSPFFTHIFATTKAVTVAPGGIYYVRTANVECPSMDSMRIDIQIPEIQAIPSDDKICAGEETALILTNLIAEHQLSYVWTPDLPGIANPIVSPLETTTYTVLVTNQFGCTASLSYTIEVTNVSVEATTEHDTLTINNPGTILTATPGGNGVVVQYEWTPPSALSDPNAPQTEATPTEATTYVITVTTEDGCIARDTVKILFRYNACIDPFVFIPKAFTPNNDNKNDFFRVHADGMTELSMIVWNRWGEIVFETNDPATQGWDGSFRGRDAVGDSFAWYVRLRCGNGEYYENKGNVTLLK